MITLYILIPVIKLIQVLHLVFEREVGIVEYHDPPLPHFWEYISLIRACSILIPSLLVTFSPYCYLPVGIFLFLTGEVSPRRGNPSRLENGITAAVVVTSIVNGWWSYALTVLYLDNLRQTSYVW